MVGTPKILLTFSVVVYPMVFVTSKFDAQWKKMKGKKFEHRMEEAILVFLVLLFGKSR